MDKETQEIKCPVCKETYLTTTDTSAAWMGCPECIKYMQGRFNDKIDEDIASTFLETSTAARHPVDPFTFNDLKEALKKLNDIDESLYDSWGKLFITCKGDITRDVIVIPKEYKDQLTKELVVEV